MIWRDDTDYSRTVTEWLRDFEHRTGKQPESYSPDSPEGESICHTYDVVEYPTILAFDDEGKLHNVSYIGGCNGNLKAIGILTEGQDASKIAEMLRGNLCGYKSTSCADQLAIAISENL